MVDFHCTIRQYLHYNVRVAHFCVVSSRYTYTYIFRIPTVQKYHIFLATNNKYWNKGIMLNNYIIISYNILYLYILINNIIRYLINQVLNFFCLCIHAITIVNAQFYNNKYLLIIVRFKIQFNAKGVPPQKVVNNITLYRNKTTQ